MISYILPFVKQNSKNFSFELFSIFDYSKNGTQNCSKFIFRTTKTGGGRGFAVSAGGNPTAKICPMGKLTNDGIWKFSENSVSGLCRVTSPFTPHQYENGTHNCSEFIFRTTKTGGAVEALPFPASGSPTAIICPQGKLTNDGIWKFFGKSVSGLCRVTSPFTPPPIRKRHA